MTRPAAALFAPMLLAAVLTDCTSDNNARVVCDAGATQLCNGPAGCLGAQVCATDGSRWLECDCNVDAGADAATADSPPIPPDSSPPPLPDPTQDVRVVVHGWVRVPSGEFADVTGSYDVRNPACKSDSVALWGCENFSTCTDLIPSARGTIVDWRTASPVPSTGTFVQDEGWDIFIQFPYDDPIRPMRTHASVGAMEYVLTLRSYAATPPPGSIDAHAHIAAVNIYGTTRLEADIDVWVAGRCEE